MQPLERDERPGMGTEALKVSLAGDSLSIAPTPDIPADVLLPAGVDLAIRRHLEAIGQLLRPRCTRCARPISAPESLRTGVGPQCRKSVVVGGAA